MAMIQIRNVPDDLHRRLKAKAAMEGVSLSELLLREATMVVHNTERALQVVTHALGERRRARHVAVPNGYEEGYQAARPDPRVFRMSFTGWLHPVMDVRVLLSAFGRLRARHDGPRGDAPRRNERV